MNAKLKKTEKDITVYWPYTQSTAYRVDSG
jgi:hypothetical protein